MTKKEFLYLMARLAIAFKEEFGKEREALYYEFLGKEDPRRLSGVIDAIIKSNQWFPKISEMVSLLHPPRSQEDEYLSYLDRENLEFARTMKQAQVEYFNKEEAKSFMQELRNHIEEQEKKELEEQERQFQENKGRLQKQKELILRNMN